MSTMTEQITKEAALAAHLACDVDEVTESTEDYIGTVYEAPGEEWRILTDEEADEAVVADARESVWAFNASFLAGFTGLPEEVFKALQPQCESANSAILALVEQHGGIEELAAEAASQDGRGHFLSSWDGEEVELSGGYFGYRIN